MKRAFLAALFMLMVPADTTVGVPTQPTTSSETELLRGELTELRNRLWSMENRIYKLEHPSLTVPESVDKEELFKAKYRVVTRRGVR